MTSLGVVTIVRNRPRHLERMSKGLREQVEPADGFAVVGMGESVDVPDAACTRIPLTCDGRMPLAAARNAGARLLDTDYVLFLDVDCIPAPDCLAVYRRAFRIRGRGLFAGDVAYLPGRDGTWTPLDMAACAAEIPGRPLLRPGISKESKRYDLAWTTSLAVDMASFDSLDGFDERFCGYGAEDTDFTHRAELAGVPLWRVGALAFHQHHGSEVPPVSRVTDIVANANLFYDLHGWWPMRHWLEAFDTRGLVTFEPAEGRLEIPDRYQTSLRLSEDS